MKQRGKERFLVHFLTHSTSSKFFFYFTFINYNLYLPQRHSLVFLVWDFLVFIFVCEFSAEQKIQHKYNV